MAHPHLVVETSPAGFRWVRLSRPERRNALDVSLLRSLTDALAAEPGMPVVLASADPRVFCAGADLTITDAERAAVSDLVYDCCETIITRPGPVIAVLTGPAVGGGAQLAAASDLRIAGPAARLRWTGPPGLDLAVGAWLLPDLVGRAAAMDLVLTGRWLEAAAPARGERCAGLRGPARCGARARTGGGGRRQGAGPGRGHRGQPAGHPRGTRRVFRPGGGVASPAGAARGPGAARGRLQHRL